MERETVCLRKKTAEIAEIRLNRPNRLNALNWRLFEELLDAVSEIEADPTVRLIVITGEGRAFATGADIGEMKDLDSHGIRAMAMAGHRAFQALARASKISIAAINGHAFGGGFELALCCDLRVASSEAKFGLPETGLGIIPGSGGTQRLPRLIGAAKAKEMIFTARSMGAQEALNMGIINQVAEPDALMSAVDALAEKILANGPIAVRCAKEAIDRGLRTDIDTGLVIELGLFSFCFHSEDQKEGMRAFFEKRPAVFRNR
ncbi:MAG: enoyl-CoA hydratase/isomerase family protein [Peptococcaceae bacterium]|nr:enoyl-CoA hydratase/isomerase family protein [Peptococcaceae bacterium]